MSLLFEHTMQDKFHFDAFAGKQKLKPDFLKDIKQFNNLKAIVASCADKSSMVDTELLKALIHQVFLRVNILKIEQKVSDLELGRTMDEVIQDCLFELTRTDPNGVEGALAEEGQVLDTLEEKLVSISE